MKILIPNSLRFISAALGLVFCLLANHAGATNLWWDNNGTSAATSGTWDTGTANWSTTSALSSSRVAFGTGNFPEFAAGTTTIGALTITVNSVVTCAGMASGLSGATVTTTTFSGSGSIAISSGLQGFFCSPGSFVFSVPLTGSGGITQNGSGSIALYANNSYTGGTSLTGGQLVYYNQNNSFGWPSGGAVTIGGGGGALINNVSTAVTIPNAVSVTGSYSCNFQPGSGGTTWSGNWSLGANTLTLQTGNNVGYVTTISGVISGAAGLTVEDVGTLNLTGVNTYSGTTTLDSSIGTPVLTIGSPGKLGNGTYSDNIVNGGTFTYNSSANQTLSGVISGSGTFTQSGSGTLTLSGANTYSGKTTINDGLLAMSADNNLGAAPGSKVANQLTLNNTSTGNYGLRCTAIIGLSANRGITLSANGGSIQVSTGNTLTVPGIIAGTAGGGLMCGTSPSVGEGTLVLSGANTYNGPTSVASGTLQLGASGSLPSTTALTVASAAVGGIFNLNNNNQTIGSLASSTGINGTGTTTPTVTLGSGTLTVNQSSSTTFAGVISGSGSLTKTGSGTLTLSGANTYSGGTTIKAGQITIAGGSSGTSGPLGPNTSTANLGDTTGSASATLAFSSTGQTHAYPLVVQSGSSGTKTMVNAASTAYAWSGSVTLNDSLTLDAGTGSGSINVSGAVAGAGGVTINTSGGSGTVTLSKASSGNTYAGNTTITQGILRPGSATAIPNGASKGIVTLNPTSPNTATFDLSGQNQTINGLASSGTGSAVVDNVSSSSITLTVGTSGSNPNGTFSGVIQNSSSGTLSLIKAGSGTLTLSGANTYIGATTVNGGILALGAGGSIGASATTVSSGATLANATTTARGIGATTVLSSGALASCTGVGGGSSAVGKISVTGNLTLNNNAITVNVTGSALAAGSYRLLDCTGTLTGSANATPTITGTALASGYTATVSTTTGAGGHVDLIVKATPVFSGLTGSKSITYGTASVTLGGTLSATGPVYPPNGETVTVTINGNAQATTINDSTGDFSLRYNLSGLVYSPTAYTISYSYAGDSTFNSASDTSKTLTVNAPTAPGITTQPQPQTACNGSNATFTVVASGGSDSYAWYQHSNAGWGSTWTASGAGSTFLQTSAQNNNGAGNCNSFSSSGDINTPGGNSWGLYGGGGESVARVLPAALTSGQVFQIDMDNGGVDSGVQNGFSLQTSDGTFLLSFYFLGGGGDYVYFDTSAHTTTVSFTRTGLRITVIVGEGSPASYSLQITPCGGSTVDYTGTFATAGVPGKVVLFNNNTSGGDDNNLYFNSMFAGFAYDNADNYSGNWGGSDKGDTTPISGATSASYTSSTGSNGDLYYAIAFNGAGYSASTSALLTVNPLPTVSVNSATICAGGSATLTATTSASSPGYSWSPAGATTASITVSPASTTTYTVTVTDGTTGCANSGSGTVTVNDIPAAPTAGSDSPVVPGSTLHLTASTVSEATYAWTGPNGFTSSDQNPTIATVTRSANAGTYSVTATVNGCTSAAGTTSVIVNTPPTHSDSTAGVTENSTLVLAVGKLLATASDADAGDTLSVTAAGPTSANGPANNVVLNSGAGTITYTPATDFTGTDTFTYTISDNYGGTVTPTITVTVSSANVPSPNIVVPPAYDSESGTFSVTFAGIPGYTYTVQTATDPNGPWSFLKTSTAGTDGLFQVLDTESPTPPARYYRTAYP